MYIYIYTILQLDCNLSAMVYHRRILNQACTSLRSTHTWLLEIAFVWEVGMHVCLCVCACVSATQAIKDHSRELKPKSPTAFQFFI